MESLYKKDKYLFIAITGMAVSSLVAALLLLGFLWTGNENIPSSNIPAYNKAALRSVKDNLTARLDVDTKGKPDTSKFDYGNPEPF